ncbi:MAG: helical backbone metal receptor [Candidatus Promineifilaceae bacterium]|nr:helical backbone metal receptor [Candidatus Promineifilaceae bacterium]
MYYQDQMGNVVFLPERPQRIVSLVPSQTELLFDLGLDAEVVGVTRFCEHPAEKCAEKTIVGGTKQFNLEQIEALQPDLILGNKEENYEEGINHLRQHHPVWMSDIYTLPQALEMILRVGKMTGRSQRAAEMVVDIQHAFSRLPSWPTLRAAYVIWRRPYRVVGHHTFAHEMLLKAGFVNTFGERARYPEVTVADIQAARPDVLLLASEPFPFTEKHLPQFREQFPGIRCVLVDGQMFTWYGSRLLQAPSYFQALRERLGTEQPAQDDRTFTSQGPQQRGQQPGAPVS